MGKLLRTSSGDFSEMRLVRKRVLQKAVSKRIMHPVFSRAVASTKPHFFIGSSMRLDEIHGVICNICSTFEKSVVGMVEDTSIGLDKLKEKLESIRLHHLSMFEKATANVDQTIQVWTRSELDRKLGELLDKAMQIKQMKMAGSALATARELNEQTRMELEKVKAASSSRALLTGVGGLVAGSIVNNEVRAFYDPQKQGLLEGMMHKCHEELDAFSDPDKEGFLEGMMHKGCDEVESFFDPDNQGFFETLIDGISSFFS